MNSSNFRGLLLFDIDGVIRDVTGSYRRAIQLTVSHFTNWCPNLENIDTLKAEGSWNNDWDTSMELIKRHVASSGISKSKIPTREHLINRFNNFYFGNNQNCAINQQPLNGLIKSEPLIVKKSFFQELTNQKVIWGFVSGAETSSVKYLLEERLGLQNPPFIAMEDAPEKPDPTGFLELTNKLIPRDLNHEVKPIAYIGDTVADVLTIKNAKKKQPKKNFISMGIAPPHLHALAKLEARTTYEKVLKGAGADVILKTTEEALIHIENW